MLLAFLNRHDLVEHKLDNRKYTWSNGRHFALLDIMLTSVEWDRHYSSSSIQDINSYGSYHCPLVLNTSSHNQPVNPSFRFDPTWVDPEEFNKLVEK